VVIALFGALVGLGLGLGWGSTAQQVLASRGSHPADPVDHDRGGLHRSAGRPAGGAAAAFRAARMNVLNAIATD